MIQFADNPSMHAAAVYIALLALAGQSGEEARLGFFSPASREREIPR